MYLVNISQFQSAMHLSTNASQRNIAVAKEYMSIAYSPSKYTGDSSGLLVLGPLHIPRLLFSH